MRISLSKGTSTDNSKVIVLVRVSAADDEQAKLVYSHSFDLQPIQQGQDVTVDVFAAKPKSAELRKYGKKLFWALFSQNESSSALQAVLPPHSNGRILLELNGDHDLDVIPWEYAWGNNAYLTSQCIFVRLHKPKGPQPSQNPRGYRPSHNPRGLRPSNNHPPWRNPNGPQPSHNPNGPPPSHNPNGPPPSYNPKGLPPSKLSPLPLLPLRIVAVVPDPIILPNDPHSKQFPDLHLSDQFQTLCDAYEENNRTVLLQRVFPPTIDQMYELLRGKPEMATVLHFMGHCGSQNNGARALIFEDHDTGKLKFVEALRLNTMNVRLAFLSACDTRHVARDLAENGIPFAIGSHCPLPDDLARKFESRFYQCLASGCTVETAMLEARASMKDSKAVRRRYYFPGAMVLYSSTFREKDGAFECGEGKPTIETRMPPHNLEEISVTRFFCGRKKELIEITHVLRRMAKRGTQACPMYTIEGIAGQGKTALAEIAIRRTAHLFPGGIFAWRFDPSQEVSIIKYLKRLGQVLFQKDFGNDFPTLEQAIITKFRSHPTCLLILDQADILKRAQVEGDKGAVALVDWLLKIISTRGIVVKCFATSRQRLNWTAEGDTIHLDGLTGLDIDSGVELFIRNLDAQVKQRMNQAENTSQLLHDLVRRVDGHPLCLKSLAGAGCLPQHPNMSLEELFHEHCSTLLANGLNLSTLFRSTIDTLPPLECQFLYMCSLFTGSITEGVLEFVRHFVEYVDASKKEIDFSEKIERNLQQLYGRGLLSKKIDEEYTMQFALRGGARLCNSMLKFRLPLPIPGLFDNTFVIGVVGPSPHEKSMALEWQLRNIQANAYRKLKTRGFGINYYSIGNAGLGIFNIPGINDHAPAKAAEEQYPLYRRLVVFIYNISEGDHERFPQFCKEQIIPLVQENQITFILCLNHTDETFERRTASFLSKKAAEILQDNLEKTHWIIRTEAPLGNMQASGGPYMNSASNLDNKPVKTVYRKRNDNVRMEGPFIGRTKDLENLDKLLQSPERYITIKGFGGMGKTSLALQAFDHFNSGDALALSLAGLPRSSQVILKIAEFFAMDTEGLNDQDQQSRVQQNLRGEETILLYLDNMEDVKLAMESRESAMKEEARILINFFRGLPDNVKILATSRIALGWPGEYSFDLAGLRPLEGIQVFRQWTPQRSKTGDVDDRSGKELSVVTDGHPLSLRLLGGMFDNCKEPIQQFVKEIRKRLPVAKNPESIDERHKSINACIEYSFDYLDDVLQKFLSQLREWNVPFTSTLIIRALNHDPATSPVADNLHRLWQRSWLDRRKYEEDPMLGDWRPSIIKDETEFYSLHPHLHNFLNHRFDNVDATLPNDSEIQFYTALCYGVGFGVANDLAKQIEWCTKAANNKHLEAQLALAGCYQGGCGVSRDPKRAFDLCLKAAEAGSKQAQSEIVWYYRQGYGVVKDEERATYWEKEGNKTAPLLISFDLSLPLIHRFVKGGDVAMVRSLCTNISDVNVRDRIGRTPLHVAAQTGHIDLIESLLYDFHADIYLKDLYGCTPLHLAAHSGCTEVVWLFVADFGVDPNPRDNRNWTPLHRATFEGHLEVVKLLLADSKVDANAREEGDWTPLHFAAQNGHVDIVSLFLADSKVDANAKNKDGGAPLHRAAQNGHVDIVKLFLDRSRAYTYARDNFLWTPLHKAAFYGHIDIVRLLLADSKADASAITDQKWTPLHFAAQNGHVHIVELLLADSKADASAITNQKWTPLHFAAQNGHVDIVRLLLADSKADANAKTNYGTTPLYWAARNGHVEVVRLLVAEFGADTNAKDGDGTTLLYYAAQNRYFEVVRLLLAEFGADANAKDNDGAMPLHCAAKRHVEVVRLLVAEFGADANAKDNDGATLLHCAALNGHVDVMRLLMAEFGADTNAKDNDGVTPLHCAAQKGHVEIVRLLVAEFGADANAKDNDGATPLHCAAQKAHVEVLRLLVTEFGADANAKDNDGAMLLHCAALNGHVEVVRLLVAEFEADARAKDNDGATPLHCAAQKGHVEVVMLLVAEFEADANAKDNDGVMLLHCAALNGHIEVVRLLMAEFGADARAKDNDGATPLHCAAQKGHVEVVMLLVAEFGPDAKDNYGETPLHCAALNGHVEVVRLLVSEFGADANAKDDDGWTPLHKAVFDGHVDIVRLFLADSKADANAITNQKWTLLHFAARNGYVDIVKLLLTDSKADGNAKTNYGSTPLHWAALNGHVEVLRLLVAEFGADANARANDKWTPLHWAALNGHVEVIRLLVAEFRADANAKDNGEWAPLHLAALNGHVEIVRLLVAEFGADANSKDNNEATPLHWAAHNGHVEVVRLLVAEFGADANARNKDGWTLLHCAALNGHVEIVSEFQADTNAKANNGRTPLHTFATIHSPADLQTPVDELVDHNKTPLHSEPRVGSLQDTEERLKIDVQILMRINRYNKSNALYSPPHWKLGEAGNRMTKFQAAARGYLLRTKPWIREFKKSISARIIFVTDVQAYARGYIIRKKISDPELQSGEAQAEVPSLKDQVKVLEQNTEKKAEARLELEKVQAEMDERIRKLEQMISQAVPQLMVEHHPSSGEPAQSSREKRSQLSSNMLAPNKASGNDPRSRPRSRSPLPSDRARLRDDRFTVPTTNASATEKRIHKPEQIAQAFPQTMVERPPSGGEPARSSKENRSQPSSDRLAPNKASGNDPRSRSRSRSPLPSDRARLRDDRFTVPTTNASATEKRVHKPEQIAQAFPQTVVERPPSGGEPARSSRENRSQPSSDRLAPNRASGNDPRSRSRSRSPLLVSGHASLKEDRYTVPTTSNMLAPNKASGNDLRSRSRSRSPLPASGRASPREERCTVPTTNVRSRDEAQLELEKVKAEASATEKGICKLEQMISQAFPQPVVECHPSGGEPARSSRENKTQPSSNMLVPNKASGNDLRSRSRSRSPLPVSGRASPREERCTVPTAIVRPGDEVRLELEKVKAEASVTEKKIRKLELVSRASPQPVVEQHPSGVEPARSSRENRTSNMLSPNNAFGNDLRSRSRSRSRSPLPVSGRAGLDARSLR